MSMTHDGDESRSVQITLYTWWSHNCLFYACFLSADAAAHWFLSVVDDNCHTNPGWSELVTTELNGTAGARAESWHIDVAQQGPNITTSTKSSSI